MLLLRSANMIDFVMLVVCLCIDRRLLYGNRNMRLMISKMNFCLYSLIHLGFYRLLCSYLVINMNLNQTKELNVVSDRCCILFQHALYQQI